MIVILLQLLLRQAENSGCAIVYGTTYHNTFESAHKCYIHSALLCGLQLGEFIEKTPALPSLPDGFVCDSGKTIVDGNEQRAICHMPSVH